ncbi:MAG: restriction endonuclease subunit S [Thiotrichaceae bacterium]|nr:restriction endonuclease subunit S [Thiotrichaceae bacterium]
MNVPKLRFKEFSGEWEKKTLGCFFEYLQSGKSKEKDENGSFVLYGSTGTIGFCKHFDYQGSHILIARVGANAGYLYEVDGQYGVSDNALVLRLTYPNNQSFFYNFLNYLNLNKLVFGSGQPLITGGLLKTLLVFIPLPPEQTKIANFLAAVDEKIEQLIQQVSLLQRYKKGVMQQIFSQQLRFKDEDGNDFPEWEGKELKDVAERVVRKNKENNQNVLTISAQYGLINQEKFFSKLVAAKDTTGYYLLHKGDFAYNKSYSNGYPMGAIKCLNNYEKGVVSTLYICFRLKENNLNSFFEHYFESGTHNTEIEKIATEGARNHGLLNIGLDDFFSIDLKTPSLPEQTKIANFLSAIDDKITNAQQQLDATKQYKKSLLQQMFV